MPFTGLNQGPEDTVPEEAVRRVTCKPTCNLVPTESVRWEPCMSPISACPPHFLPSASPGHPVPNLYLQASATSPCLAGGRGPTRTVHSASSRMGEGLTKPPQRDRENTTATPLSKVGPARTGETQKARQSDASVGTTSPARTFPWLLRRRSPQGQFCFESW